MEIRSKWEFSILAVDSPGKSSRRGNQQIQFPGFSDGYLQKKIILAELCSTFD